MNFGIAIDLLLVLVLQIQRNAVHTALEFSLSPLQQAHVVASTIATVLYFPTLYLGWTRRSRVWHLRVGVLAFLFRTFGFILMFSLLSREAP